jgi:peptidase YpeB-like protein
MTRRHLIATLLLPLALATVEGSWPTAALAKDGDSGGSGSGGDSGGRGGGDNSGRGGGDSSGRGGGDSSGRGSDNSGRNGGDDGGGRGRGRGGDDDGQGRGRGRGGDDAPAGSRAGWGSTSSDHAREAVSQGWALALSSVLPTVTRAVPGQVLEVDLRQSWSGDWRYEFLVLTRDRRYQEITVDARSNQILQIRRR